MNRIPTLDGWRGIAILMVLVTHFQATFFGDYRWCNLGQHGVQIFFVLSGYLITSRLLMEERISLRAFYVRRAFRILPAALSYLSVCALLTAFTPMKVSGGALACVFFFRNYVTDSAQNNYTVHFWSLSLEEQFYLIWPAILALLGRLRASLIAILLVLAIAVFRILNWSFDSAGCHPGYTQVRADGLLIGCLLALVLGEANVRVWVERWAPCAFWLALPVFVFDIYQFHSLIPLHESVAIAAMIGATSLHARMLPTLVLEQEHLKTTGVLSYSIYIWQQLFLRPNWGFFWPILLGGSFLFSYVLIEQPVRRFGRRLAARTRPATAPTLVH